MPDTYAIIETGGKQYRAEKGTELLVDRLSAGEGDKVTLRPVMFRGDGNVVAAGAALEKVKVEAVVSEHLRGEKIRVFTYKAKKGVRKRRGHRSELTRLEVTDVKMLSRKPAAKSSDVSRQSSEAKAETAEDKPAAEKKPAAKKPAAKKPAAKKPAAKKPAAKKPAAKKPAAKKEDDA
jgi:large subunit ribosomal protein L21